MAEKFTLEKHQERMRRILTQSEPRPNVISSLLERARGRKGPPLPKLPRV